MSPSISNALETGMSVCRHLQARRDHRKSRRRYRITQLIGAVNSLKYKRYSAKQVEPEFDIDSEDIEDCTTSSWTLELTSIDGQVYERLVEADQQSRGTSPNSPPEVPPRPTRLRSPTVQVRIDAPHHEVASLAGRVTQQLLTESELSSVSSSDPYSSFPESLSSSDAGHSPLSLSPSTTRSYKSREEAVSVYEVWQAELTSQRNTLSKPELLYLAGVRLDEIPDSGRL
ncbi:hypothetical protein A1Q2_06301 [Trichosporon asahii var. asahii CBS 8904]|uniref:Uncharacterized protein n=1 Tax=Trichosporon asahii var. asahii (strain CBS 8904) TaxID=1220162 RepID=K1V5T7_TRIAC|nr:hypothetical protein A1Q2_06301 [Trichosporon asahii var. asahii CBS 8904]